MFEIFLSSLLINDEDVFLFFFFKQKTAYEMRISDWSSDVCSSDLDGTGHAPDHAGCRVLGEDGAAGPDDGAAAGEAVLPHAREDDGKHGLAVRSDERRVGKDCVSTCRSRGSADH